MKKIIVPENQGQLVEQKLGYKPQTEYHEITEKLSIPGIESLHLKSVKDIADILANILKSRVGIKSLTYRVGQSIEITSDSDTK